MHVPGSFGQFCSGVTWNSSMCEKHRREMGIQSRYPPREGHPHAVFVGNWPFSVLSGMYGLSVRPLVHFNTQGHPDPCRKDYLDSGELNTG